MIQLSKEAGAQVSALAKAEKGENLALRVAVRPGGCSGFSYDMFFDASRDEDDTEYLSQDVKVVIDKLSASMLEGATLNYTGGLSAGFSIDNPNANRTCGCGNSFS